MIYDTFPFFNELELLEVRLHELDGVVDRFVLAESTRTHSNQPKPLHFAENRERFQRFLPRITHIVVEDNPDSPDAWALEGHQRACVARGLAEARPDDLILHSDIDEIPRAEAITALRQRLRYRTDRTARLAHALIRNPRLVRLFRNLFKKRHPFVHVFEQRQFYYFLNLASLNRPVWPGTRAVFFRDFTSARDLRRWEGHRVPDAGWHFSYMGGVERVRAKLQAFAHQEFNRPEFTDPQRLATALTEGRWALGDGHTLGFVPVDATFPRYLLDHLDRFPDWVRPTAGGSSPA